MEGQTDEVKPLSGKNNFFKISKQYISFNIPAQNWFFHVLRSIAFKSQTHSNCRLTYCISKRAHSLPTGVGTSHWEGIHLPGQNPWEPFLDAIASPSSYPSYPSYPRLSVSESVSESFIVSDFPSLSAIVGNVLLYLPIPPYLTTWATNLPSYLSYLLPALRYF